LNNPFGGDYSADGIYQSQILGNSGELHKKINLKKPMITTRMRICKGAHCRREYIQVINCVMMDECSGRKKDGSW